MRPTICSTLRKLVAVAVAMAYSMAASPMADAQARDALGAYPQRIEISPAAGGTDFQYASGALRMAWTRPGGDYLDANGELNGPTSHSRVHIGHTSKTVEVDLTSLHGDVLLRFEGGPAPVWSKPLIDGHPVEAFWVDSSANHALGAPLKMPAFIRNPAHGKVLTLQVDNVYQPGTVLVDQVQPPRFRDLPVVHGGLASEVSRDEDLKGRKSVLRYLDFRDERRLRSAFPPGTIAEPFAFEPEWIRGPAGMPALRFSSFPTAQRLISWFLRFEPREGVYARYCLMIEPDVADGMTERGVKLPGLAGDEVSWRMEHGPVAPANRGAYAVVDYLYDAESGPGFGRIESMNAQFHAGRWYSVEQYIKLNTPGRSDGIGKVWIDGNLVWSSSTVKFRNKPGSRIDQLHVNVYHGGMGLVRSPIHYRLAGVAVATSYIGPPPGLSNTPSATGDQAPPRGQPQ